jgi:poly(3-hydroxybutyrate) depolymerase
MIRRQSKQPLVKKLREWFDFSYYALTFQPKQLYMVICFLLNRGVSFMINRKVILGMLIFLITILLATNVLAAEPKFDKKAYKKSLKYAYKQINKNQLVKKGLVDKYQAKKIVTKILKEKYQKGEKITKWKIRVIIKSELNKLRGGNKVNLIQLWNKYHKNSVKAPYLILNDKMLSGAFLNSEFLGSQKKVPFFEDKSKFSPEVQTEVNKITKEIIYPPVVEKPQDIFGCTDSKANNYNHKATKNEGCTYDVLGCLDSKANNYNQNANINDGSCIYGILGCTDSKANNYDSLANIDDGKCKYSTGGGSGGSGSDGSIPVVEVPGCTDVNSFNFDLNANKDDDSCIAIVEGCTDETANNYNEKANTNDNSCTYDVSGCTNEEAFNYNEVANVDDGSCIAIVEGCLDENYFEYNANANTNNEEMCVALIVNGCTDNSYLEFNANANVDDNSCQTSIVEGCTDQTAFNFNSNANTEDNSCISVIEGCLDSNANNFKINANVNDNSCIYDVLGCMDQNADNYNIDANVDDNSCQYSEKYPTHENILTTYFWIGEDASEENSWVSNHHSAWDEDWVNHYGGIDNPDCRNEYHPCDFTPKENPFYCALPYSDFDENGPKSNRLNVPWYEEVDDQTSIIKNRWVKVIFNGKEGYCQLQDAGPGSNDDFDYVFGNSAPIHWDKIGLDTSPAVRDYLGLDGMDQTNWQFIDDEDVPNGPWKEIVTTSGTCWGSSCKKDESVLEEPIESTLTEHNLNVNFNNQVKNRKYFVYEPATCKDKECPLLFMFHGLGGNAAHAAGNTYNWQATADTNGFVVVFPESLTLGAKVSGLDPAGKKWDITPLSFSATQDTKFVEEMITEIDLNYDINKEKMFTTGHSYGGYFSYYLNFALNNRFKAFATHSAGLIPYETFGLTFYWPAAPSNAKSVGNVPAMIIHSSDDSVAPKLFAETLETQMLGKNHAPVDKHDLVNKGHSWDISMNQEQWDFFVINS